MYNTWKQLSKNGLSTPVMLILHRWQINCQAIKAPRLHIYIDTESIVEKFLDHHWEIINISITTENHLFHDAAYI